MLARTEGWASAVCQVNADTVYHITNPRLPPGHGLEWPACQLVECTRAKRLRREDASTTRQLQQRGDASAETAASFRQMVDVRLGESVVEPAAVQPPLAATARAPDPIAPLANVQAAPIPLGTRGSNKVTTAAVGKDKDDPKLLEMQKCLQNVKTAHRQYDSHKLDIDLCLTRAKTCPLVAPALREQLDFEKEKCTKIDGGSSAWMSMFVVMASSHWMCKPRRIYATICSR